MSKDKKKSWKQSERQLKQQRKDQTYQSQLGKKANPKNRFPMQKVFAVAALVILLLTSYGIWQYYEGYISHVFGG